MCRMKWTLYATAVIKKQLVASAMNPGAGRFICLPCEFLQTILCMNWEAQQIWPCFSVFCHASTCFAGWELILCFASARTFGIIHLRSGALVKPQEKLVQLNWGFESLWPAVINVIPLRHSPTSKIWKWATAWQRVPCWYSVISMYDMIKVVHLMLHHHDPSCPFESFSRSMPWGLWNFSGGATLWRPSYAKPTWGKFLHSAFWCRTELASHIQKPKGSHCNAFLDQEGWAMEGCNLVSWTLRVGLFGNY